jgi:hypothetical protein
MKQILVIFLLGILLWGCGKKAENKVEDLSSKLKIDTTELKTVPIENANLNFNTNFNFQKGKTYQYRLTTIVEDKKTLKIDSTINQSVKQSTVYLSDITLTDIDKDGVMEFSCNFSSILNNTIANNQVMNYQSGKSKDSTSVQANAQYEALIDNPFGFRVGKNGGILEIFRIDKIVDKLLQLRKPSTQLTIEQKEKLRDDIVRVELKPLLNEVFREMPTKSLMKDSTWTNPQPASEFIIFKLENTNLFKVTGLEKYGNDTLATIDAGLKSIVSGDTKVIQQGVTYNFKRPQPMASGTIYFNLSKGCIQKSNVKTQVNISYTMEAPSRTGGTQKGLMTDIVNTTNILELL